MGQAQKLRDTFAGRTRHRCDLACVQPLGRKGAVGRQFFLNRHRLALHVLGQTDFEGHGLGLQDETDPERLNVGRETLLLLQPFERPQTPPPGGDVVDAVLLIADQRIQQPHGGGDGVAQSADVVLGGLAVGPHVLRRNLQLRTQAHPDGAGNFGRRSGINRGHLHRHRPCF